MVTNGVQTWGYFGVDVKGRFVFSTVGAYAGVIVGPAVGAALAAFAAGYVCARRFVAAASAHGSQHPGVGQAQHAVGNPLGGAPGALPRNAGLDPREEARKHWKNGTGELPPGWDWTDGERGRVCYVDFTGATTYTDPRKNFEVYAHEFALAAERGVDLLNMCVGAPCSPHSPLFTLAHTFFRAPLPPPNTTIFRDTWAPSHDAGSHHQGGYDGAQQGPLSQGPLHHVPSARY